MEDSFPKSTKEALLKNQSSSSSSSLKITKFKLTFCLLILFSIIIASIICIFTVLKRHTESQSLSHNPKNAIQAVCSVTQDPDFCFDAIYDVYISSPRPDQIDPTQIFALSLVVSWNHLSELVEFPKSVVSGLDQPDPEIRSVLGECEFMFVFARSQINESMARLELQKSENGKMLVVNKLVWDLQSFISDAQGQVRRCTEWLESTKSVAAPKMEWETKLAEREMAICREILSNRKDILDMFYPRISSVVGSLVLNSEYDFSVFLFCSQYLVLIFLFCFLFRI